MLEVNIVPINDQPTTNYWKQNRETGGKERERVEGIEWENVPSESHMNFTLFTIYPDWELKNTQAFTRAHTHTQLVIIANEEIK